MPPSCSTASATKRAQLVGSMTSSGSAISVSSRSTRRAPPATRTPASASMRAVERPNPDEAPVTIAVLPLRSTMPDANRLRVAGDVVDLERRVLETEALAEQALEPPPRGVAVDARRDEHMRGERGEAARHRPDVQIVDLARPRPGRGARWRRRPGRCRWRAPSRKMRPDSRRSDQLERTISAATSRPAIGSKRFQPVARTSAPATAVPTKAARSVATWRNAPRTLRPVRSARARTSVAARLTRDAGERDPSTIAAVHGRRSDEPADGGVDDPARRRASSVDAVRLRGEDLGSAEPERPLPVRRAAPRAGTATSAARARPRR